MKILFCSVHKSTFIKGDIEILQSKHSVKYCDYSSQRVTSLNLFRLILESDLVYFWFISLRFVLPLICSKILGKKVIFVAGGYDVAKIKELNYGSMSSRWKSAIIKNMLKSANKILSVSNSNYSEIVNNCRINPQNIIMIYHGLKPRQITDFTKKENSVVTIGFIDKLSFYRKGVDRFLKLAEHLSDVIFHLVGKMEMELIQEPLPRNIIIHGYLQKEEFDQILSSSKIYVQFSRHEAFGYSIAEAMQFGCIPVVSNSYSLPEVVGDTGLILDNFENYQNIADAIKRLLNMYDKDMALKCVNRINNIFPFERRAQKILELIDNLH